MARKRISSDHSRLPKYVYIRRGYYIYRPYIAPGKFGKDIKLCPEGSQISRVWAEYETIVKDCAPPKTLDWLIQQYLTSGQHLAKAPKTKKEYEKAATTLSNAETKVGPFGQVPADRITPGVIRKYIDARKTKDGQPAPVAANREIAFLSICYSWAVERDILTTNPCKSVSRNSERARTRYVTPEEYQIVFHMASAWPHVQAAMEFAYLCRMRLAEVLDMRQSDILEQGLLIRRRKGSRHNITTWSTRLRAAVQLCETLPNPNIAPGANTTLIRGQRGDKMTEDGFSTTWQRLMIKVAEAGRQRFTFHDLKAAGVSDTEGNKQEASGHRSAAMVDVYNRKLAEVKPAGE